MQATLSELAQLVDGKVIGDGSLKIEGVAGIKEASPGDITFLANPKYSRFLDTTQATAVIVSQRTIRPNSKAMIVTDNPYAAFLKIIKFFIPTKISYHPGVHSTAVIGKNVKLGNDVSIGACAVIEDEVELGDRVIIFPGVYIGKLCKIGNDTVIYPNVSIREKVTLGERVIVHCGVVIGSDGFGFTLNGNVHQKIPQVGTVIIEDDVEIGANVTIDRATIGVTRIGKGTKLDNLVQIGHNVTIGENSIIIAQVGISGSTEIGKGVTLAGQAGLVGHIQVGDYAVVGAQAGVTKSVPPGSCVSGYPARPHNEATKLQAYVQRLPKLHKKIKELEERIEQLENK